MSGDLDQLGRVVGGLIVVLMTIALVARVARRAHGENGGSGLKVVERIGLSREANLAVVEISDRKMLLGVTSQGVTMLADFNDAEGSASEGLAAAVEEHRGTQPVARSRRADSRRRNRRNPAVAGAVVDSLRRQLGLKPSDRSSESDDTSARPSRRTGRGKRSKGFGVTVPTSVPSSEPGFVPGFGAAAGPVSEPENIDADELREHEDMAQELAAAFGSPAPEHDATELDVADDDYAETDYGTPDYGTPEYDPSDYGTPELDGTRPEAAPAPVDALLIDVRDSVDTYDDEPTVTIDLDRPVRASGRRAAGPPKDAPRTRAENRALLREAAPEDDPTPLPHGLNVDEFPDLASALRAAGRTSAEPEPTPEPKLEPEFPPVPEPRASVDSSFVPDESAALLQRPKRAPRAPQIRPEQRLRAPAEESLSERTARQVAAFQAEAYPGTPTPSFDEETPEPRPTPAPRAQSVLPAQASPRRAQQAQKSHKAAKPSRKTARQSSAPAAPRTWRQGVDALRDLTVRRG
ncbi:FliO/MopB family protein [Kineosporia babensis]|uniref:Flagellar biosynthetic protein FliO n=1 Tax=Kineosporia babensis TaxID=499548 RepID=A0A9X1NAR7_9ACTN|nr:flagellar biosynthetic protein FliO [Kineosporia babensis]MCD5309846.1 flagellar biosynthetic protein FliO [Kineosporia babensis]